MLKTIEEHKRPGGGDTKFQKVSAIPAVSVSKHIVSETRTHVNLDGASTVHLLLKNGVTVTSATLEIYFYDRLVETVVGGTEHLAEFVPTNPNAIHFATHGVAVIEHDGGADTVFVGKTSLVG